MRTFPGSGDESSFPSRIATVCEDIFIPSGSSYPGLIPRPPVCEKHRHLLSIPSRARSRRQLGNCLSQHAQLF